MSNIAMRTAAVVLALLGTGAAAQEASPRKELKQLVEQLQGAPDDDVLRAQIISIVRELKPKPAIPKEARLQVTKAMAIQNGAQSTSDYELAIAAYGEALRLAPWWANAYWNLSLAQEMAGKYADARSSLKLYKLADPKSAGDADERLAVLDGKSELAAKHEGDRAAQDAEAKRRKSPLWRFRGQWEDEVTKLNPPRWFPSLTVNDSSGELEVVEVSGRNINESWDFKISSIATERLSLAYAYKDGPGITTMHVEFTLTGDSVGTVRGWTTHDGDELGKEDIRRMRRKSL